MNCTLSMSCLSANSAVESMVSTSSSSEPTTNMPWMRILWAWNRSIARSIFEVLLLLEELERAGVDRLEADVDIEAVRVAHELEELGIVHGLGPHLGAPVGGQAPVDHAAQQLFDALLVRREDVVGEERVRVTPVELELLQHPPDRMRAEGVAVHAGHRAERARERAAPRRRDRDDSARLP